MNNPDYKMYGHLYNVLTQKGQHTPSFFQTLLNPFDTEEAVKRAEANFDKIKVPAYTGAGWYAYSYKLHLQGCQNWYCWDKGTEETAVHRARPSGTPLPFIP